MTQGDLVMSMDQLLTKPRLGTCHKFYMQPFTLPNRKSRHQLMLLLPQFGLAVISLCVFPDESKTLMFFDGCPPQLGCSIKLRGASEYELARVKDIIMLMVCVAYHSQLEISFLMDEFAMPPSLPQSSSFPCLLEGSAADEETEGDSMEKTAVSENSTLGEQSAEALLLESSTKNEDVDILKVTQSPHSALFSVQEEAESPETRTSSPCSSPAPPPPLSICPHFLVEDEQELGSDTLVGTSEGETTGEESHGLADEERSETPSPKLFRDPLQDDTGMFIAEHVDSSDDRLKSISAVFKHELKDIILCISPFITFKEPFLLTPAGMHCPSRDYFPEEVRLVFYQTHARKQNAFWICSQDFCVFHSPAGLFVSSPQQGPKGAGWTQKTSAAQRPCSFLSGQCTDQRHHTA